MAFFSGKDFSGAEIRFLVASGDGSSGTPYICTTQLAASTAVIGHVIIDSSALPSGASTAANQSTIITALGTVATDVVANGVLIGAVNESAAANDTASSGLNGLLKRVLQRITNLITAIGSPFQAGGSIGNTTFSATQSGVWTVGVTGTFWQATQPVSNAGTFAVQATLAAETTKVIGTVNVSAGQTIGVTGTFWQATQPVSIASMPSTPVTGTFWQATQPISAASLPLPTGAATETGGNLAAAAAALGATSGTKVITDAAGTLQQYMRGLIYLLITSGQAFVTASLAAGSQIIGKVGIDQTTPGTTNAVSLVAAATGGSTPYTLVSAATTNATNIKASAGKVTMITVGNTNASARFLKLFNKASPPTMGTDTAVLSFIIPGNTSGAGTNIPVPAEGIDFSTGISIALCTGASLTDNNAVAANELTVNIAYK